MFKGFNQDCYTRVPDQLFDELLPILDNDELRVLLYIIRRTTGFDKDTDAISYNQFLKGIKKKDGEVLDYGCGVKTPKQLRAALKSLEEKGIIIATRQTAAKGNKQTTTYMLHFEEGVLSQGKYPTIQEKVPVLSQRKIQDTVKQETDGQDRLSKNDTSQNGNAKADIPLRGATISPTGFTPISSILSQVCSEAPTLHNCTALREVSSATCRLSAEDYVGIKSAVDIISQRFADNNPDNTMSRIATLFHRKDCSVETFRQCMFDAHAVTKDRGKGMGYFFTVLENMLFQ